MGLWLVLKDARQADPVVIAVISFVYIALFCVLSSLLCETRECNDEWMRWINRFSWAERGYAVRYVEPHPRAWQDAPPSNPGNIQP